MFAASESPATVPLDPTAHELCYAAPAAKWDEALPVGNGQLGAMVFGGVANERIQFNEDTVWTGKPHDYARESAGAQLAELRRLILAGNDAEAKKLGKAEFLGSPVRQKAYQPFGDIRVAFPGHEAFTDYRRALDLDRAVATVRYRVGEATFTREVFASHPARALVVRLASDKPGTLTFTTQLTSPHAKTSVTTLGGNTLVLRGAVQDDGVHFEARLLARVRGGTLTAGDGSVSIRDADEAVLVLVGATNFQNYRELTADPAARCEAQLKPLVDVDVNDLRLAHIADHRALYRRAELRIGDAISEKSVQWTNERIRALRSAPLSADPSLSALYFHFGRYLLIASSRPGGQPANLQGKWNELLDPPWESKFTTNINFEMNYWPAEVTNLGECHEPFFALVEDLAVSGHSAARKHWNSGGWVLHHNTDLWRGAAPLNNIDGIWPTGGAWLCWHLWEHYRFSGDRAFLAKRAYPVMKEAARFFLESMVEHPTRGWLVTLPSYSPEQGSLTAGPAMDTQLIRALFAAVVESAHTLDLDAEFAAQVEAAAKRLPPDLIGRHGQLQEWLDDVDAPNNAHRHMSPLWALFPGDDISADNPKSFDAAKRLLRWRGDGSTGWSYAWRIPLWARVGDGDFALRQFSQLLQRRTLPNLFDLCGPFQIDGNFGAAAGLAELLLQSHRRVAAAETHAGAPVIELLPALPKTWPSGAVRGLRARGGFEIDLEWRDGKLARAEIRSTLGGACRLRSGEATLDLTTKVGGVHVFNGELKPVR